MGILRKLSLFSLALAFSGNSAMALARNIYLNGIDISSARHQFLQNVSIRIDGNGNLFIEAPQYQVNEENTYTPLSQWQNPANNPQRAPAGQRSEEAGKVGKTRELPSVENTELPPSSAPQANEQKTPAAQGEPSATPPLIEKEGDEPSER